MLALLLAAVAAPLQAAPVPGTALPSPGDPLPADWRPIADDDLLVMTLTGGRTVLIRLAPRFAPAHVANVRRLAMAHWWDGTSVYRVQENWVAQWGGQPADAKTDPLNKPLPAGIVDSPAAEYDVADGFHPAQVLEGDAYSHASGITADGWAVATGAPIGASVNGRAGDAPAWLTHCYGTVGVARDVSPDTGSGSELFMPLGGSARRLDRNYTIVGRVIEGAHYLAALPRSGAPMGMYATTGERTAIVSVRLASDLPPAERPHYEFRAADNPRFAAMIQSRIHPKGLTELGGIDVCDVPLATRRVGAK